LNSQLGFASNSWAIKNQSMVSVMRTILFAIVSALLGWGAGGWILTLGFGGWVAFMMIILGAPYVFVLVLRRVAALCSFVFNITTFMSIMARNYWLQPAAGANPLVELDRYWHIWLVLFLFTCLAAAPAFVAHHWEKPTDSGPK
jgi:hypothetical protein